MALGLHEKLHMKRLIDLSRTRAPFVAPADKRRAHGLLNGACMNRPQRELISICLLVSLGCAGSTSDSFPASTDGADPEQVTSTVQAIFNRMPLGLPESNTASFPCFSSRQSRRMAAK
jgi:hypothetical protein